MEPINQPICFEKLVAMFLQPPTCVSWPSGDWCDAGAYSWGSARQRLSGHLSSAYSNARGCGLQCWMLGKKRHHANSKPPRNIDEYWGYNLPIWDPNWRCQIRPVTLGPIFPCHNETAHVVPTIKNWKRISVLDCNPLVSCPSSPLAVMGGDF